MGGKMFAIHFRSSELYRLLPHARAWMYWAVNRERRAFMATVNGRDEFNFHTQLILLSQKVAGDARSDSDKGRYSENSGWRLIWLSESHATVNRDFRLMSRGL